MSVSTPQLHEPAAHAVRSITVTLGGMMFMEWAIRGIWMPYLSDYLGTSAAAGGLGFTGGQVGWILGFGATLGAITAPLVAGQLADRALDARRALALLLLPGGLLLLGLASVQTFIPFLVIMAIYSITYMPTQSLTTSICFQNIPDGSGYPRLRLWGTLGWIVGCTLFPLLWLNSGNAVTNTARMADALRVAGVISILYAVYALICLPKTPPSHNQKHPLAFVHAFGLLRHRAFLILILVSIPLSMIHQAMYFRIAPYLRQDLGLPLAWVGPAISIGQWGEIGALFILGFWVRRLGFKWVLIIGAMSYVLRFVIFAIGEPLWLVIAAQALHGPSSAGVFAAGAMCVDRITPTDVRHSAQMVFGIAILGSGPILAALYNQIFDRFQIIVQGNMMQSYTEFWWMQAAVGLIAALLLLFAFPRKIRSAEERPTANVKGMGDGG